MKAPVYLQTPEQPKKKNKRKSEKAPSAPLKKPASKPVSIPQRTMKGGFDWANHGKDLQIGALQKKPAWVGFPAMLQQAIERGELSLPQITILRAYEDMYVKAGNKAPVFTLVGRLLDNAVQDFQGEIKYFQVIMAPHICDQWQPLFEAISGLSPFTGKQVFDNAGLKSPLRDVMTESGEVLAVQIGLPMLKSHELYFGELREVKTKQRLPSEWIGRYVRMQVRVSAYVGFKPEADKAGLSGLAFTATEGVALNEEPSNLMEGLEEESRRFAEAVFEDFEEDEE